MLMLTVLQICLIVNGRTLLSRAHAIDGRLMLSWVTSYVCTTPMRSLEAMAPVILPPLGMITLFLPTRCMKLLRGQGGAISG
jgi:hypothetical protein